MISADRRMDVLEKMAGIIRTTLRQPELNVMPATRAGDVEGWDSLSHLDIILSIEKAFKIRLKAGEVAKLENVGSLIEIALARGEL
jgi:acyl carrier protein